MALAGLPVLGQRVAVCARARATGRFLVRRALADTAIPVHRQVTGALAGHSVRGERVAVRALAVAAERCLVGGARCQTQLPVEAQEVFALAQCLIFRQ